MKAMLGTLHELLDEHARDRAQFGTEAVIDFCQSPGDWQNELETWREAGGTHLALRAMDTAAEFVGSKRVGYQGPADYIAALEKVAKEIGDA